MTDDMPPDPWEGELPDFPTEWTETHRDFAMLLVRGNLDAEAIVGEHDFEKLLHAVMAMDEEAPSRRDVHARLKAPDDARRRLQHCERLSAGTTRATPAPTPANAITIASGSCHTAFLHVSLTTGPASASWTMQQRPPRDRPLAP